MASDQVEGVLRDAFSLARAVVVPWAATLAWEEHLDGGVALHAVALRQIGVCSGIHGSKLHFSFEAGGGSLPLRSQLLAVAAPRREELHQPDV